MNNIVVYLEIDQQAVVADVSLELLSKGKELAMQLGCQLEAVAIGSGLDAVAEKVMPFGVDRLHIFDEACLIPYTTLIHSKLLATLLQEICPNTVLIGATAVGRDLAPRVAAMLRTGLTAHCSNLRIADYTDKDGKTYHNVLEQIRPAFGDKAMTTIVCPQRRPQMATVSAGVMKQVIFDANYKGEVIRHNASTCLTAADKVVTILSQSTTAATNHLKDATVVVAGGYGVGSKKNFLLLKELAALLHGEVGATRAATDAGWIEDDCMIGQTGLTVRPKLYIACGISGQAQHVSGMQDSDVVVSINTDADAPINKIADYVIIGKVEEVLPKMISCLKQNNA